MILADSTHWHVVAYLESGGHEVCPVCFEDLEVALTVAMLSEPFWPGYVIHVEEVKDGPEPFLRPAYFDTARDAAKDDPAS
jgi:hypothetical protein